METGRRLERTLVKYAAERVGLTNVRHNVFRVSKEEPILSATCDGIASHALIEAKTSSFPEGWGDDLSSDVPDYVLVQTQHALFVTGLEVAYVPLLLASRRGFEWRLYKIPRYPELIHAIVERCVAFWRNHIQPRIPPSDEPPPLEYLQQIRRTPTTVHLPAEVDPLIAEYVAIRQQIKELDERRELLQRQLITALGDAQIGIAPSGWKLSYTEVQRRAVDLDLLRTRYPEVAKEVERLSTYHRFDLREAARNEQ
jgi:predicted phage-related endonuclease